MEAEIALLKTKIEQLEKMLKENQGQSINLDKLDKLDTVDNLKLSGLKSSVDSAKSISLKKKETFDKETNTEANPTDCQ